MCTYVNRDKAFLYVRGYIRMYVYVIAKVPLEELYIHYSSSRGSLVIMWYICCQSAAINFESGPLVEQ